MPIFDPTINVGNIVTIIIGIVTLTIAWVKLGGRLDMLEFRVNAMEDTLKRIAELIEKQVANEKQIALLHQEVTAVATQHTTLYATVEGMRRGEGFVIARRGNLEGEYGAGNRNQ